MKAGYIKIFRSIEDWEWIDDPVMFYFWGRILLMANWEDRRWHGKDVERGSFITSLSSLSEKLGLSVKQVRTCLCRLEKGKQIETNGASDGTKVTICKYDYYQGCEASEGQAKGKPDGKQRAKTKEEYNYNTSDTNVSSYSNSIQEEKKKKEEDTGVSSQKEPTPFSFIQKLWNDSMTRTRKIPKVASISQARKDKINLRIGEMGGWESAKGILAECFKKINESDFCNGENDHVWVANIDWFFSNDKNWLKVYEGNYDNRQRKTQLEIMAENFQKASAYYEQRHRGYGDNPSPYGSQAGSGSYSPDEQ